MSQFVRKSPQMLQVVTSSKSSVGGTSQRGSTSNASRPHFKLASLMGVRKTSVISGAEPVPAPDPEKAERNIEKETEEKVSKKRTKAMRALMLSGNVIAPEKPAEKPKPPEKPTHVRSLGVGVNTYATWKLGNKSYEMDIGGGAWKKLYNEKTQRFLQSEVYDKLKKIQDMEGTAKKWSLKELRDQLQKKLPYVGVTGGDEASRKDKVEILNQTFGPGPFHALTFAEEREWTGAAVRDAMLKLTGNDGTFTMIAVGSTDAHIMSPYIEIKKPTNLRSGNGMTLPNYGYDGTLKLTEIKDAVKADDDIQQLQKSLKGNKDACIWLAGSLSYFIKGKTHANYITDKNETGQILLKEGQVFETTLADLAPTKDNDLLYYYNYDLLETILGTDNRQCRIFLGARK